MAQPVHIGIILPRVFHGVQRRYLQNFEPEGKEIIRDLKRQIREKGIGRRGKLLGNSRRFSVILGNSGQFRTTVNGGDYVE